VAGEPKGDPIQLPHRAALERATGFDFRNVRAYADPAGMDRIGANAASHGNKVWFGSREPSLETVAHELAHVRQAGDRAASSTPQRIGASDSPLEHEAATFASAVARGGTAPELGARSDGNTLHLDPKKHPIKKIDINFDKRDAKGNGIGKAHVVVTYEDGDVRKMEGDGGGKVDKKKKVHPTSGGTHAVDASKKDKDHTSNAYTDSKGNPAPMKYYTPFAPGEGFHVGNVNDMSHGCIHLDEADAKEIYENAGDNVPVVVHVPKVEKKKKAPAKKDKPKKEPKKETPKKEAVKKPPSKKKKAE